MSSDSSTSGGSAGEKGRDRFVSSLEAWFVPNVRLAVVTAATVLIVFVCWVLAEIQQGGFRWPGFRVFGKKFYDDCKWICVVVFFFYSVLKNVLTDRAAKRAAKRHQEELQRHQAEALHWMQKDRIHVLRDFEPAAPLAFLDHDSIYNSIIRTLERLEEQVNAPGAGGEYRVCMLLCSPALDYEDNPRSGPWGEEFWTKVDHLLPHASHLAKSKVIFDVCHLPLRSRTGINSMNDFLAALANYLAKNTDDFQRHFGELKAQAKKIAQHFADKQAEYPNHCCVRTPTIHIPFQMVLATDGKDFHEATVSFAGREILERESSKRTSIQGFFSSDRDVVNAFLRIYKDYVEMPRRQPFTPVYTRKIVEQHVAVGEHEIKGILHGLVDRIHVDVGLFSPAVANSSKFTGWALERFLTARNNAGAFRWTRILDLGSGTGILALVADEVLKARVKQDKYSILALDADDVSRQNLVKNSTGRKCIAVRPWRLGKVDGRGAILDEHSQEVADKDCGSFDLIIADLPYVDADPEQGQAADPRFIDPAHRNHAALFSLVRDKKARFLKKDGVIITSFSTLGGPEDVAMFEGLICANGLQVIQRVEFFEHGYMWIVYLLMAADDYKGHKGELWWQWLGVQHKAASILSECEEGV